MALLRIKDEEKESIEILVSVQEDAIEELNKELKE